MVQQGVGQGTVTRLRRNPRERVEDVAITDASGLSLGADGYPHPIETDPLGNLKSTDRTAQAVLEDLLSVMNRMYQGMVLAGLIEEVDDGSF